MAQLDGIQWHDAVLSKISIDRSDPGNIDEIEFDIWSNSENYRLKFIDVYYSSFELNFGVVAEESIRSFDSRDDSDSLNQTKSKWDKSDLISYILYTNSTNSRIEIICTALEISLMEKG